MYDYTAVLFDRYLAYIHADFFMYIMYLFIDDLFCINESVLFVLFLMFINVGFLIHFAKHIFGTIYCANVLPAKQDYYQSSSGRLIGAFFKTSGGRFKKQDIWNKYRSETPVGSRGRQTPQSGVGCADLRLFVRRGRSHHRLMLFLFSDIVAGVLTPVDAEL